DNRHKETVMVLSHSLFFNKTATTEIYTLSLHDALPISTSPTLATPTSNPARIGPGDWKRRYASMPMPTAITISSAPLMSAASNRDRKSTRLNSSHVASSYAVFCLKKKNTPRHRLRLEKD